MNARRWRRWRHGGLAARRACRRSRAACRRYPSAADRNYQGGNTTEQRELGPGLSFHLTSLSEYRVFAIIRGTPLILYPPMVSVKTKWLTCMSRSATRSASYQSA
jgi:hypothetical protein